MKNVKLMQGNNIELLKKLPDNSIDSVVSDPPYGLSFMSKKWDYDVPSVDFWKEVYRVLKPGGHVLSFGGTRTYHRMVVNIEDAGFEIRDQIQWLYGSGFPKSFNIGKSVDKLEGNEREVVGEVERIKPLPSKIRDIYLKDDFNGEAFVPNKTEITKGTSPYEGWGTALKPANEPICVARKPLSEKSVAENVIKWKTGGINIDGCRVGTDDKLQKLVNDGNKNLFDNSRKEPLSQGKKIEFVDAGEGRFPANLILDEEAAQMLDEQSGYLKSGYAELGDANSVNNGSKLNMKGKIVSCYADKGGASRFFYVAKVSKKERNMGLDGFEEKDSKKIAFPEVDYVGSDGSIRTNKHTTTKNNHPTVKPINLMAYLCRLITPENGIVLDPFMGSGSTGVAALLEGFRFCGMEMDENYFKIAEARINNYEKYREFLDKKKK